MTGWELAFWISVGLFITVLLFYIAFQQGKESGCQKHEFRISKVQCIHCGREEARFKNDVVETKVKNASTPSH